MGAALLRQPRRATRRPKKVEAARAVRPRAASWRAGRGGTRPDPPSPSCGGEVPKSVDRERLPKNVDRQPDALEQGNADPDHAVQGLMDGLLRQPDGYEGFGSLLEQPFTRDPPVLDVNTSVLLAITSIPWAPACGRCSGTPLRSPPP